MVLLQLLEKRALYVEGIVTADRLQLGTRLFVKSYPTELEILDWCVAYRQVVPDGSRAHRSERQIHLVSKRTRQNQTERFKAVSFNGCGNRTRSKQHDMHEFASGRASALSERISGPFA